MKILTQLFRRLFQPSQQTTLENAVDVIDAATWADLDDAWLIPSYDGTFGLALSCGDDDVLDVLFRLEPEFEDVELQTVRPGEYQPLTVRRVLVDIGTVTVLKVEVNGSCMLDRREFMKDCPERDRWNRAVGGLIAWQELWFQDNGRWEL